MEPLESSEIEPAILNVLSIYYMRLAIGRKLCPCCFAGWKRAKS